MQSNYIYLKIIVIAGILSMACTTKVSEWILLNSEPENYLLIYHHKEEIPSQIAQEHNKLEKGFEKANVIFKTVKRDDVDKPIYELYYRNRLISTYPDLNSVKSLTSSTLRDEIAAEIMSGKLCVMLLLKSGSAEKDKNALQTLNSTIAESPFKGIITVAELERNNPDERIFIDLLLNVEDDLKEINEPMLFGVFGRFRALEPLLAKGISSENINFLIDFLSADCSCLIKDNLPGVNILYNTSWEDPEPAMVNNILDANPFLIHR